MTRMTARQEATIVAACRCIEQNDPELRVARLADELGLSRAHFQRLFKRCTGITPKAYQQAVRRRATERALGRAARVTDALFDSGYASAARFYEGVGGELGMPPSRRLNGGTSETVHYGFADTTLGRLLVARTERGVCAVLFGEADADLQDDLAARFPKATIERGKDGALIEAVVAHVEGGPAGASAADLPLDIRGTVFQQRVWAALRELPSGETVSYAEMASRIGQPGAARAVAGACAANPLAVLVPCHRVVRGDGSPSGYRWGIERKRALLEREAGRPASDPHDDDGTPDRPRD